MSVAIRRLGERMSRIEARAAIDDNAAVIDAITATRGRHREAARQRA